MNSDWSKYLNVKDLARYLGMSKSWLYQNWPKYVLDTKKSKRS